MLRWIPICLLLSLQGFGQDYFPPNTGNEWLSTEPTELGYCPEQIDSLMAFLEANDSKSFILIKDGRMVLESYFGTYTQDSLWYWASAGKSLAAYLVGIAQADGLIDLASPVSDYLGSGWTSAPADKEALITIRDLISMTSGLADNVLDPFCLEPSCLSYGVDAGEEWSYYSAPYRLVQDIIANEAGVGFSAYTYQQIGQAIGMGGFWFEKVRYGKARDMARFGLLALNQGQWDGQSLLGAPDYVQAMTEASQVYNEAYGYLWWLNGSSSFMLPQLTAVWPGSLIPNAPEDMYAALGKNDQKTYVIPSQRMVVVRQGQSAGQSMAASSSFDNDLWAHISALVCSPDGLGESEQSAYSLSPNPAQDRLQIKAQGPIGDYYIFDSQGRQVGQGASLESQMMIHTVDYAPGLYMLRLGSESIRFIKR